MVYFFVQLLKELERVTGIDVEEATTKWTEKWALKIFQQAKLEISSGSARSAACADLIVNVR